MHRLRFVVPFAVLVLDRGRMYERRGRGRRDRRCLRPAQEENTGTVNVLNATSAEESEALQNLCGRPYGD